MPVLQEIRFAGDHARADDQKLFRFEGCATSLHARVTGLIDRRAGA